MRKLFLFTLMLSFLIGPLAYAQDDPTIAEQLQGDENFSTLLAAVEAAGLLETLSGEGPLTVFAPTNAAFEALPPGMLEGIMSSPPSLQAVLNYHVAEGTLLAEDIADMDTVPTVLGAPLSVTLEGETIVLNGSAKVVQSDLIASNGVVHVIDAVLVPARPGEGGAEAQPAATEEAESANTIADVVAAREDLAFLNTALSLTPELAAALARPVEEGDTTGILFAPNADAFLAMDTELREAAIADPILLTSIFLYHLVDEAALPEGVGLVFDEAALQAIAEADDPIELPTLLPDAALTLSVDADGNLLVNDATVVEANIEASNGYINVIDALLIPPDDAILTQEEYDEVLVGIRASLAEAAGEQGGAGASGAGSTADEGPALDPNWAVVGQGFGMAELDTADDFFQTVVDPFTNDELYGVQIINWTAEYKYTGFIVEQFLPADVLLWMNEQDPTTFENISDITLQKLPPAELAKLPEELQARVQ